MYEYIDVGILIVLYIVFICIGVFFYLFYYKNVIWIGIFWFKINIRCNSELEIYLKYNWWFVEFINIFLKVVKKFFMFLLILFVFYKVDKC